MSEVNDFLRESRMSKYPNATFERVGDSITGVVASPPRIIDSQFGKALVVDLANDSYSEGGRTLWIKQGQMAAAIADACGDDGLAEGGRLTVVFTGEKDTGKPSPLKEYAAQYEPPRAKVDMRSIFPTTS